MQLNHLEITMTFQRTVTTPLTLCLSRGVHPNQTYGLSNPQNESLKPGERVELLGKKIKDDSGEPMFEVHKMNKDLGQCTPTSAENR